MHWCCCWLLARQLRTDDAVDQYAVAAGHYGHGRWEMALSEFRALVRDFPDHPKINQARFYIGESLVQLRRFDEASKQFFALLDQSPGEPLARKRCSAPAKPAISPANWTQPARP